MGEDPRRLEERALQLQRDGSFAEATDVWLALVQAIPNWEFGYPHYYLADCYTRIGQLDLAEAAYRRAIAIAPEDALFSDALKSFLEARAAGLLPRLPK